MNKSALRSVVGSEPLAPLPAKAALAVAIKTIDKAAQKGVTAKNTAARNKSRLTKKVLDSAIANAVNNNGADAATLYVKEARVDAGPVMKRHMFDSRSHIGHKDKRTSHIVITVASK